MPGGDGGGERLRVLAVANFDSFVRAADLVARGFAEAGAEVEMALLRTRDQQISAAQIARADLSFPIAPMTIDQLCEAATLDRYDVLVMALDGSAFRRFFLRVSRREGPRPLVAAIYPGLVLRYHYDGFASRSAADFLWLNSHEDLALYHTMCAAFGADHRNARAFGLPALLGAISADETPERKIVFCEQAVIPRIRAEREYLAEQLVALARRFPDHRLLVKPRNRRGEYTLHRSDAHIETLLEPAARASGGWPANLEVTHDPVGTILSGAALCVTISSTVALQAIHAGIGTAVIADFGAHEDHGLPFFFTSGLVTPFAAIDPERPPRVDPTWAARHLLDPRERLADHIGEVVAAARENRRHPWPPRPLSPLVFAGGLEDSLRARFDLDRLGARAYTPSPRPWFARRWFRRLLERSARKAPRA